MRTLPIRTCSDNKLEAHRRLGRPCLLFHIEKCAGPCVGEVDRENYDRIVADLGRVLGGDTDEVEARLPVTGRVLRAEVIWEGRG